jgi:hypothetical protein
MKVMLTKLGLTLLFCSLLLGCSSQITGPESNPWLSVPCEYRLEGGDQSILIVRAQVAEFDSAKIVLHTLCWTVYGDTLSEEATLFPHECQTSGSYTIFTSNRPLPMNTAIRSVELFIKEQARISRNRFRR